MRSNRKLWVLVPLFALLVSGCGGFQATRSISPATFLLPGLLKADPPPVPADAEFPLTPENATVAQL